MGYMQVNQNSPRTNNAKHLHPAYNNKNQNPEHLCSARNETANTVDTEARQPHTYAALHTTAGACIPPARASPLTHAHPPMHMRRPARTLVAAPPPPPPLYN